MTTSALCAFGGAVDPLLSRKRGENSYGRPAVGHVEARSGASPRLQPGCDPSERCRGPGGIGRPV